MNIIHLLHDAEIPFDIYQHKYRNNFITSDFKSSSNSSFQKSKNEAHSPSTFPQARAMGMVKGAINHTKTKPVLLTNH
jgi:hypothetical protein